MAIFNMIGGKNSSSNVTIENNSKLTVTTPGEQGTQVKLSGGNLTSPITKLVTDKKAIFTGLADGTYKVSMKSDVHTSFTREKEVTVNSSYGITLNFFMATANITFPSGYTCTATCGNSTLTSSSSPWNCILEKPGEWTFKLNNGLYEKITVSNGSSYTINKWYLYKDGEQYKDFTGGWTFVKDSHPTVTINEDNIKIAMTSSTNQPKAKLYPTNPCNLYGFSTLGATGSITKQLNSSFSKLYLGIWNKKNNSGILSVPTKEAPNANNGDIFVAQGTKVQDYELSVDISSIANEKVYPYFLVYTAGGIFTKMWVEC